jgi:outer membrane receptor protein involved in Fe transport
MRSFLLAVLLFSSFYFPVYAQSTGKVSGSVKGNARFAVPEGATVSLLKALDSSGISSSLLQKEGTFSFSGLTYGKYLVMVNAVGCQTAYSPLFEIASSRTTIILAPIQLQQQSKTMNAVTVSAKKPLIEQKIDRTIVNVDASVTNAGATALEVLEKSPGVVVDRDGNISLKGKEGVMVMIDGRPAQLGGADLANLLRNMNASQLDQVEIMTNPPARYDAAGNAGIINIKTKKLKTVGFNGSLSLVYTQGRYPKTAEGFNFNYRSGKINLFASLNHGYRQMFEKMTIQRNIFQQGTREVQNYFDQESNKVNSGSSFNNKIGFDYFATAKTSFGISLNRLASNGTVRNRNQTNIANAFKDPQSVTRALVENNTNWKNYGVNANFRTVFDSTGREISGEADYITYNVANKQFMTNAYFDPQGYRLAKADSLIGDLPQGVAIYSGRVDYFHPLKKGAKFEAGLKSSIIRTDNNAVYDSLQYGRIVRDINRSNHFIYEENINAAYVNLSGSLSKKLSAQLGLRLENTNMKGTQLTTGATFDRRYTQLFPTAFLQYAVNGKNNLGLNYGRRIRRPNYESLNPFIRFMDRYTYSLGNPNLKPQTSHNMELSHTYHNKITTTINYSTTTDIIQNVIEQKGEEAYAKPANIASLQQFGVAVSVNSNVTKWWTNNLYINLFHNNFTGVVDNTPINFAAARLLVSGTQQFKLTKTLTGEINGGYRTAGLEGVIRMQSIGVLSIGFSQQVFQNKGSIRLSVRDILYTQRGRATTKYGNVDAAFQEVRDSRTVSIGFSYRFSKGKMTGQKKKASGSANEEQDRVGMD